MVVDLPDRADAVLLELGLVPASDGRQRRLPDAPLLFEIPDRHLDAGTTWTEVAVSGGRVARVFSLVDLTLQRLEEFQGQGHPLVARQVIALLLRAREQGAMVTLRERAASARPPLAATLRLIETLAFEIADQGRRMPETYELHDLARQGREADLGWSS